MKPITIIGGGLAGLTLGIALRRSEVPVTIVEAGHYPRHRACGEFINGRGISILNRIELTPNLLGLHTRLASDTAFFFAERKIGHHRLPSPALCVSRFELDAALSSHFQQLGGELRIGERWGGKEFSEGLVCATGRRAHPVESGWRWFGLKVHARGVSLVADLEMHLGRNTYVGLCRLANDEVNVCGLFRHPVGEATHGESLKRLRGEPGSALFARLEEADFDENSLCAVGGLSLRPEAIVEHECRIGDALTMIPPITGNGMSMAFESAQGAVGPLVAYSHDKLSWTDATTEIAQSLRRCFQRRLCCAELLHRLMFLEGGAAILPLLFRCSPMWRASFALTR